MLPVTGLRALLGELADTWYGRPSAALAVVAVTGTNGKTSSVQWIAHALSRNDKPCGTIGTLGAVLPDGRTLGGALATPDVLTVHRALAALRAAGQREQVMIDCSHANSNKSHLRQIDVANDIAAQLAQGDARITGVMIESHLEEGRQDLKPGQPLRRGVSITDACLGWSQTEPVLDTLAIAVRKRREKASA
ncbi:hypothetical protein G6F68_015141 [Rhizopus microsporus]|nr:hypothetical protein G6F68_015141 [Rhizopus microsporus]